MAFNWDKLSKARREYPKPKFALSYIDKLLKKSPGNPYLTTWRADVSLQLQSPPEAVAKSLVEVCQHKSTLQDELLLEYAYRLIVEAAIRSNPKLDSIGTVGNEGVKAWQNAAALKTTKKDRKNVWDDLFTAAMRQGCWDDARTAIVKYRAEAASTDKISYYTQIFAQQMSAEQKIQAGKATGVADRMAEIQLAVALKQMKDAYERPESDPISVKDIRDLRFMAKIYARQGKFSQLLELWKAPPAHLQPIMKKHALDVSLLTVDILSSAQQYELLKKHILDLIEEATSALSKDDPAPLQQLCSARVNVWTHLIEASTHLHSPEDSKEEIMSIRNRVFDSDRLKLDRPLRLVRLILRTYLGESLLRDCKDYFKHFSRIPSCFIDLRRSVENMSDKERAEFLVFAEEEIKATKPSAEESGSKFEEWARSETCVLKFTYLIAVSLPTSPSATDTLETLVERASKISQILPKDPDPVTLVIYCLTKLHHHNAESDDASSQSSRTLLQAAMLARTAVERDTEKHNRALALLATRLHLSLGLGTVAFQVWKHVKPSIKEMLVDTLSPYLLSRIALTQPFDVKHHQGFSADQELKHVVETVDRMSKVQEGLIFRDIKRFHWDSAMDLISMNQKLTTSLTRHTSILERRRIARLKGEPAGDLPDVKYSNTQAISDNIDRSVLPAYEHSAVRQPYSFLVPADFPSADAVLSQYHNREAVSKILYHDGIPVNWAYPATATGTVDNTPIERLMADNFWHPISSLLHAATTSTSTSPTHFSALLSNLSQLRRDQERLVARPPPSNQPADQHLLLDENQLIACYSALEILRLLPRLAAEINVLVVQPKTAHPMKSAVPKDWAKQLDAEVKATYEAIGRVASSAVEELQKRGVAAIKAQMGSGRTGAAVCKMLGEGDVEHYAREYVDAGVAAWRGVLSVKLK